MIGSLFKNRYGSFWFFNFFSGMSIFNIVLLYTHKIILSLILMIIYYLLFSIIILWFPFFLKYKQPKNYRGIWKKIGEWLGDPLIAFPKKK